MYQALLIVQFASIFILFAESVYIFTKWKTRLHGILFFGAVTTLVNNMGYLLEMTAKSEAEYMTALKMSYMGRIWIPFALFLFTIALTRARVKKPVVFVFATIHAITFGLVLLREYTPLYYSSATYVEDGLFPHMEFGHGYWYLGYTALLFVYIIFGLSNLFYTAHKEKNKIVKKRLICVTTSITIESLFYVLGFTNVFGCYDSTMIGYTIGGIVMCVAILYYDLLDTLELARDYVIDEVSEGVIVFNQSEKIEYMNKKAREILSKEKNQERTLAKLAEAATSKEPLFLSSRFYSVTREDLEHKDTARGHVLVLVDETEHIEYVEELEEQKNIAEAANASKSAFLSVVSHEIRTPMNAVVGMTDLLLRESDSLTDKQEKYLRNIKNSGSALVMIVNDILDQSKIEAGKMELVEEQYELRPMLSDVMMIIENRVGSKPIELKLDVEDRVSHYLVGDSLRIRQILINLMNNAVKFTELGRITLSIVCVEENDRMQKLRFSVKDTGQGIRPEDLNKLGKAFSQVDTKKNYGKEGTGLGLSISKDFISMMGGQLEVASEYGKGSEFYFTIEQGMLDSDEVEHVMQKQAWQEEAIFTCPDATVLYVDDTPVNLMVVQELLKTLNLDIDTATSGREAIDKIASKDYDLVFMDYMMPYMDGVETTMQIRKLQYTVPIIALSGDQSEDTKKKFIDAGISDAIDKPVAINALKDILLKWLPEELIKQ